MSRGIDPKLLDELLKGQNPKKALSFGELLGDLENALAERVLNVELEEHLDSPQQKAAGNHRNGYGRKTVTVDDTAVELSIRRDRDGKSELQLIERCRRRFSGFDQKIIAMYTRGLSPCDIQAHVAELYGIEDPASLNSAVTDAAEAELEAFDASELGSGYPKLTDQLRATRYTATWTLPA